MAKGTNQLCGATEFVGKGRHKHWCPACGTVWVHGNECAGDAEAHECPMCGRGEYQKFAPTSRDYEQMLADQFEAEELAQAKAEALLWGFRLGR